MQIDYSHYETTSAEPEASSMIETFRAIGYSIEAAIADIIDNSISANAKNIWVNFTWQGSGTWISVKDDGNGMTNDELVQAMRPGSKNPNEERNIKDPPYLKEVQQKGARTIPFLVDTTANISFGESDEIIDYASEYAF